MDLPSLNIIRLKGMPIFHQLQLEEALFRADTGNWCLINDGTEPAVVMGLSGQPDDVVPQCSVPVIRRFSGGGTVVVDEETVFFSLIINGKECCPTTPRDVLAWTVDWLRPVFHPHMLVLEDQDYVIDGQKIGGNAQAFSKGRIVHHTSFLWSWSEERMNYLSMPQRQPAYRQKRSHHAFCNKLSRYFISRQTFCESLQRALAPLFACRTASLASAEEIVSLSHRKAVTHI